MPNRTYIDSNKPENKEKHFPDFGINNFDDSYSLKFDKITFTVLSALPNCFVNK